MKTIYKLFLVSALFLLFSIPGSAQDYIYPPTKTNANNRDCHCDNIGDPGRASIIFQKLADREKEAWLRSQEAILKDELERRLGEDFPSFRAAQEAFFRKRFAKKEQKIY